MDLLDKYKEVLNKISKIDDVLAIFIFGSYITKKNNKLSDLDVSVLIKDNSNKNIQEEILSYSNKDLDINIFNNLPIYLKYKIITEGKVFYQKIDVRMIKKNVMIEWLDFKPHLIKQYKRKYGVIKL